MNDRITTILIGIVSSVVSFEIWQSILTSFCVAFVGGVAAWLAKKICESVFKKMQSKKTE